MADADAFLAKAEESLASAEDDFAKARYNSCARNAYYAAFQAAVAALIGDGIQPEGRWEHYFVQARLAGILIRRRKLFPAAFASLLSESFKIRAAADYSAGFVGQRKVRRILSTVRDLVKGVRDRNNGDR